MMQASIILAIYNGRAYLPGCLFALMPELEAYPGSEVVAVDDASTDGSADWIADHYPQVHLSRSAHNQGFAAACNQGAAAAKGEVLVFLNQDTRVAPGWLQALVDGLSQDRTTGLVTSKLLFMEKPDRIQLCGQENHYTGLVYGRGMHRDANEFNLPAQVSAVSGASFAIRRALWEQLGGFDAGFFMYSEEIDLSWRASLQGYTCWYIPGSRLVHDVPQKPSPRVMGYVVRNRVYLLLKHWKLPMLLLLLPAFCLTELVEWVYLARLGPRYLAAKLRACAWLLGHPGQILRSRRRAQAGRLVSDARRLEQCAPVLSNQALSFGTAGRKLVQVANRLYALNYSIALKLARWFSW